MREKRWSRAWSSVWSRVGVFRPEQNGPGRGGTCLVNHGEGGERPALMPANVDARPVHPVPKVVGVKLGFLGVADDNVVLDQGAACQGVSRARRERWSSYCVSPGGSSTEGVEEMDLATGARKARSWMVRAWVKVLRPRVDRIELSMARGSGGEGREGGSKSHQVQLSPRRLGRRYVICRAFPPHRQFNYLVALFVLLSSRRDLEKRKGSGGREGREESNLEARAIERGPRRSSRWKSSICPNLLRPFVLSRRAN